MPCTCGHEHTLLAEREDADKLAVEDMTNQAKSQSGAMATLTRARVKQLKAEISAEQAFASTLRKARAQLLETVETAITASNPLTLLNLTDEQLLEFILQGGLGLALDEFTHPDAARVENNHLTKREMNASSKVHAGGLILDEDVLHLTDIQINL